MPSPFWARVLPQVKAAHPYSWIFGEVIHGDYPRIIEESTMDSITQYELWKSIQHALETENFFELDWNLKRHNAFLDSFVPQTFIGNHDVTRIASQIGPAKAALALAVLMTVGGVPSIYYGDEQGYVASSRSVSAAMTTYVRSSPAPLPNCPRWESRHTGCIRR